MEYRETTAASEIVYDGKIVRVRRDTARLHNGKQALREVVEHPGGVCVAAVDDKGNVWLVDQFRYPFMRTLTELPAGKLERGEDPDAAAARELREETGFAADSIERVGELYPSPGYTDEILYMYIATGLRPIGQQLDEDEFLSCYSLPLPTAVGRVLSGDIADAKTVALLLLCDRRFGAPQRK
ncbi:MAG: NUDIX hydrolase [Oscillospiraceae bacterium]|nr:NUDIX hydrolase [Oscillospiraceae bacterium]